MVLEAPERRISSQSGTGKPIARKKEGQMSVIQLCSTHYTIPPTRVSRSNEPRLPPSVEDFFEVCGDVINVYVNPTVPMSGGAIRIEVLERPGSRAGAPRISPLCTAELQAGSIAMLRIAPSGSSAGGPATLRGSIVSIRFSLSSRPPATRGLWAMLQGTLWSTSSAASARSAP